MSTNYMKDSRTKSQQDYLESEPEPTEMPRPTSARAGSLEKVDVLILRRINKQQLWHPDDNTLVEKRCSDRE
jgi:hypothetical protein